MLVIVNMMFIALTIEVAKMMFVVKRTYMICRDLMLTTKTILIADLMFVAEDFVAKNNRGCRDGAC
jgi:hypothetical protein